MVVHMYVCRLKKFPLYVFSCQMKFASHKQATAHLRLLFLRGQYAGAVTVTMYTLARTYTPTQPNVHTNN